ncbi:MULTISPECIES: hypothetical protein [Mycobacterium]|uniref:hypothetical protein n=1 Tax=Mycobacterium TaxID=1763 RepID=UPI001EF04CFC|nr:MULTISPECIES: hypothetical protein [Mycobacterium]
MATEAADPQFGTGRRWRWVAGWGVAALISIVVLVVAIVGRTRGHPEDKPGPSLPTLRPMAASESMSDERAFAVAANTVRVWMRERNERHLANVLALSCPDTHDGVLAAEIAGIKGEDFFTVLSPVDKVVRFTRSGPVWTVDAIRPDGGVGTFTLQVRNGELLVCQIGSAPVP